MSNKMCRLKEDELAKFVENNKDKLVNITWDRTINLYGENLVLANLLLNKMSQNEDLKDMKETFKGMNKSIKQYVSNIQNPSYQIAIVGAIKAGKSTLINALLGYELASVNVTPETATLTKFKHSEKNCLKVSFYKEEDWNEIWQNAVDKKAEVFMDEYKLLDAESVKDQYINKEDINCTFDSIDEMKAEIAKWTSSKKKEHYFVKELEIGLNSLNLPPQICLVDTPGLNDVIDYRSKITRDYIDSANCVIVCVNAKTLRNEELLTIARVFSKARYKKDKIYILGTQIDTMNSEADWEAQKQEWIKYLKGKEFFESISTAKEHLIGISSYAYMKAKKLKSDLTQDDIFDLIFNKMISKQDFDVLLQAIRKKEKIDIEALKKKIIKKSRIEDVQKIISEKLLADYNNSLFIDCVEKYKVVKGEVNHFVKDMTEMFNEKKEQLNKNEEELNVIMERERQRVKKVGEMTDRLERKVRELTSKFSVDFTELTDNFKKLEKGIKEINID